MPDIFDIVSLQLDPRQISPTLPAAVTLEEKDFGTVTLTTATPSDSYIGASDLEIIQTTLGKLLGVSDMQNWAAALFGSGDEYDDYYDFDTEDGYDDYDWEYTEAEPT